MDPELRQHRRQLHHDVIISSLALISVAIGVYELARPRIRPGFNAVDILDLAIVGVFILDFIRHARQSGNAWAYAGRHWWELPTLIPITGGIAHGLEGFSIIRGLRLVRLFRAVRLLRVVGAATRLKRIRRYLRRIANRARLAAIAVVGVTVTFTGAVVVLLVEGAVNPRLATLSEALWWSLNVFTTVGYLDFQPVTAAGHVVAGALMVAGVSFIGVFTASLANAILTEPTPDDEEALGLPVDEGVGERPVD